MHARVERLQGVLARYTGKDAALDFMKEQAAWAGAALQHVDDLSFGLLVDGLQTALTQVVGRRAGAAFRDGALRADLGEEVARESKVQPYQVLLAGLILAGALLMTGLVTLPLNGIDLLLGGFALLAAVLLARVAAHAPRGDLSWLFITGGMGLSAVAFGLYWRVEYLEGIANLFPSVADIFWLASSIALMAGVLEMLIRLRRYGLVQEHLGWGRTVVAGALLAAVAVTCASLFGWMPMSLGLTVDVIYLLIDLIGLVAAFFVAVGLRRLGWGKVALPWRMIAIGLAVAVLTNVLYIVMGHLGNYPVRGLVEFGWFTQAVLMGWAALEVARTYTSELADTSRAA